MLSLDRVRANTSQKVNRRIDDDAAWRVEELEHAPDHEIWERIRDLEAEWDVERYLESIASAFAFTGVSAAAVSRKRGWLAIPGVVLPFLFLHAVQGWCPPLPVLRRLGVRTQQEIDQEKTNLVEILQQRHGSSLRPSGEHRGRTGRGSAMAQKTPDASAVTI